MRKVFFLDSGLRNMVLRQFESIGHRPDMGALVENAIFSELTKFGPDYGRTPFLAFPVQERSGFCARGNGAHADRSEVPIIP